MRRLAVAVAVLVLGGCGASGPSQRASGSVDVSTWPVCVESSIDAELMCSALRGLAGASGGIASSEARTAGVPFGYDLGEGYREVAGTCETSGRCAAIAVSLSGWTSTGVGVPSVTAEGEVVAFDRSGTAVQRSQTRAILEPELTADALAALLREAGTGDLSSDFVLFPDGYTIGVASGAFDASVGSLTPNG